MPALAKKLYEETGFSGFGRNELDLQIRTYCEFLMRAAFFETVKETANAFLYRVIALDMLLGSGSESGMTKEVSTRAGVITAHAYGMAFDEAVKQVRDLYKWRSKFVHEGKLPPEAKIEVLRRVNEAVLFALLRVRRLQVAHAGSEITTWRKGLDFIATGLEVGRTFESDDLARAGLK
jgi:hypothetical protein